MKKFLCALILLFYIWTANAQYSKSICYYPDLYVGVNAGINYFLGESAKTAIQKNFTGGMGYSGRFMVGYDFSTVFGVRGLFGFNDHNFPDDRYKYSVSHFTSETLTGDLMINLTNLINYQYNSPFYLSAFVGAGMAYLPDNKVNKDFALLARVGLQADFKLSKGVYLNLIGETSIAQDHYNDYVEGYPYDIIPLIAVGISYHLTDDKMHITRAKVTK